MSTVPTQEMSFTEGSIKAKHNKTQQDNETVEDFKSICRIHITLNIKKQRKTSLHVTPIEQHDLLSINKQLQLKRAAI